MRRVLVIGASARAAAASAHRGGYRVHALDLFADRDLQLIASAKKIESDFPRRAARLAENLPSMPWLFTGGLENYPDLVEQISQSRTLFGTAPQRIQQVRDPGLLAQTVNQTGFRFPPTRNDPPQPAMSENATSWLRKPRRSCGGFQVRIVGNADDALPETDGWLWQKQILGTAHSAAYVADGRRCQLLGITRQWVAGELSPSTPKAERSPFAYVGSVGPLPQPTRQTLWKRLGTGLTKRFELTGVFGVDAILPVDESQRPYVLEVNPRYTASMEVIEMALGKSIIGMHIDACQGKLPDVPLLYSAAQFGKAYCFATRRVRVTRKSLLAIDEPKLIGGQYPTVADIPQLDSVIEIGQPVMTVFATASDAQAVEQELGLTGHKGRLQRIDALLEDQPSGVSGMFGS